MQFDFSYSPTVSQAQIAAFEMAGKIWASYLTDNVTVKIAVDFQGGFVGNTIAGAMSRVNTIGFPKFKTALLLDSSSVTDVLAAITANVKGGDITARFNQYDAGAGIFKDLDKNGSKLQVNSANAKALGLDINGGENILDGYVVMRDLTGTNTSWDYNLSRTGSTPTNAIDFVSVAVHEIGHILGFQSSVDQPWFNPISNTSTYNKNLAGRVNLSTPLDLFRYSDKAGTGKTDLAQGGTPYLSISAGVKSGYFDTGTNLTLGGNGKQASHFASGGIMAAEVQRGTRGSLSSLDLTAFDAIGWNIDPQGANKVLNYSQLATAAQQAASLKTKQDISFAMASMFDNSDVYKPKDIASLGTTDARTGSFWQEFFARTGSFWQEFFARTGSFWQGMSGVILGEGLLESLEGDDIVFSPSNSNQDANAINASPTNTNGIDLFIGKVKDGMLVGEYPSSISLGASAASQFVDFGFFQSNTNFQTTGSSVFDQKQISQGVEFSETAPTQSNVVLGSNKPQLSSISDHSQLISDSFTPWWLGDSSSLWAAR